MEEQSVKRRGRPAMDITGLRSGRAVALEPSGETRHGARLWKCQCDCGKLFYTEGSKIKNGAVRSCGCLRNEHQFKELTGRRFGKLTALRRLDEKRGRNNSYLWLCRCDCGNEITVNTNSLLRGSYTSCGCGKRERLEKTAKDAAGQRFGRLTALRPTRRRMNESVVWLCRCDCGREAEVPYSSLVSGNTRSCGCLKSEQPGPPEYMHYIDGTCVEMLESRKLRKDNTSGSTGVQYHGRSGKWVARITFKGKTYSLGRHEKLEDAVQARKEAENRLFGEFLDWYYATHAKLPKPQTPGPEPRSA